VFSFSNTQQSTYGNYSRSSNSTFGTCKNFHFTFDLLHPGWCYQNTRFRVVQLWELYHLLEFPAVFALINRAIMLLPKKPLLLHYQSWQLATGHSNVVLADFFGFSGDGMVSLI
jgi:hypothetical protein